MNLKIRYKKLLGLLIAVGVLCVSSVVFSDRYRRGGGFVGVGIGGGGIGVGVGGRHGGLAVGIGSAGYWDRWDGYYYDSYYAPYWGQDGAWLESESNWVYPENNGPQIYNRTGQPIKFYISDFKRGRYTLTVVTQDGTAQTFKGLRSDAVDVIYDEEGNLAVVPR